MTPEDVLLMLDVLFDVRVRLAPDREHLELRGASKAVECASPMVLLRKPEIVAHLRSLAATGRPA